MAMKCLSCGGTVTYDIKTKKLKCNYCDSSFELDEYDGADSVNIDVYQCGSCGAELTAPEEQIVAYCMYCGNETSLVGKVPDDEKPKAIIPFSITKEFVKEKYLERMNKILFAPDEFYDPEFIEEFRGVYIPYWRVKAEIPKMHVDLNGKKCTTEGRYDYTRYYSYSADVGGTILGGSYDASAAFDDTIASEIGPFKDGSLVDFKDGYLAGFYADKATVDPEVYEKLMDEKVFTSIKEELSYVTGGVDTKDKDIKKAIPWGYQKAEAVLFPVWFLTWRKNNRVAYMVMNGDDGKMAMDVPVDFKKMLKVIGIMTLSLFVFFSILPVFILPVRIACIASVLLLASSIILRGELKRIRDKEQHIYDLGDTTHKAKKKMPGKFGSVNSRAVMWYTFVCIVLGGALFSSFDASTVNDVEVMYGTMFFFQAILVIRQLLQIKGVKNKIALVPILFALGAQLAGCVVADISRQHDFWYYGLAIGCFAGIILNIVTCIRYINYLATRPVPNFFSREGANNGR